MTDFDLIAGLRPEVPLPDENDLAATRSRLMSTLAFEPGVAAAQARPLLAQRAQPGRRSAAWRRRSTVFCTVAAAGVAVACAVTLAVSAGSGSGSPLARGQGQSVPATLTAVQFLTAAAAATGHEHAGSPPAPDQYVYTETVTTGNGPPVREWLSADGSRPGLVENVNGNFSVPACTAAQAAATGCNPAAGYLSGLPVHASAIPAYLARIQLAVATPPAGQDTPNWLANDTGKAVSSLLQTTYLLPAQQSALFQLLAHTPGFQIVRNAADKMGRRGVGIYWFYQGSGAMIVFDPATYRYLGSGTWGQRDVPANGQIPPASGGVVTAPDGTALAAMAIVDSEPTVTLSAIPQKPYAWTAQALQWARRQPGHQLLTIGADVADYLREVLHMSPAHVQQHMRAYSHFSPFLCVRDAPQYLAAAKQRLVAARRRGAKVILKSQWPCPAA